jgi:hypothetical protein
MDVFCPNCLHRVTLESREPGRYAFDCPECAEASTVTIPNDTAERPVVRPVRKEASRSDPQILSPRPPRKQAPAKSSSDNVRRATRPSRRPSSGKKAREPASIDFPFEASDENLVDEEPKLRKDEFDAPEYLVPQPLRGGVIRERKSEPPPRRRKEPDDDVEFSTYLKRMAVGAAIWLVLVVAAIFIREAAWGMIFVAALALFTARRTFLSLAMKEGPMVWLACLLVPFYTVLFAISHFRKTATALLITVFGYGYIVSGLLLFVVHDIIHGVRHAPRPVAAANDDEADPDEELQKAIAGRMLAGSDSLTLQVDGAEVRVPVQQLTTFDAMPGKNGSPPGFEFSGPDVSLRGDFPATFEGDWKELLGNAVPILPQSDQPAPGDSHIQLPGRGLVKVKGGKFVMTGATTVGQPVLHGGIELDLGGRKPETIVGTFMVHVKAGH